MRPASPPSAGIPRSCLPTILLGAMVAAVYGRAASFPFVALDDNLVVYDNPVVREGLTLEGVRWALTNDVDAGWIPLTWLSRMADVSLFGMDAGGHHLVNVLFHLANVLLLFHALRRMTGRPWESWLVAALFAVHPLHVESVAWVTERKDVLAGFFWMLSLWAYARYSERPGLSRYLAVALCFALGLMSKPIVVTLPFVLLLLDFWPLGRLRLPGDAVPEGAAVRPAPWRRLVLEKAPLLAMSAAASAATAFSESTEGVVRSLSELPLLLRVANALQSCVLYLWKMAWPARLSVFYPHPGSGISPVAVAASALLLAAVTALALRSARSRRWLAVGWFWFLGVLVPVSGLVQFGGFSMADRAAYLAAVGIYVSAVFGIAEAARGIRVPRPVLGAAATALLALLSVRAFGQVGHWRDTGTLFRHALAVTENNWFAHCALGKASLDKGSIAEAEAHFREALRIAPGAVEAHTGLALVLFRRGDRSGAEAHFREALRISPGSPEANNNLGVLLSRSGRREEAIGHFREALRIQPGYGEAHASLGVALAGAGSGDEALSHLIEAVRLLPQDAESRNNLGAALAQRGRLADAEAQFREALRLDPGYEGARRNLSRLPAASGNRRAGSGR